MVLATVTLMDEVDAQLKWLVLHFLIAVEYWAANAGV